MGEDFNVNRIGFLSRAISRRVGVEVKEANLIALRVLNYFGYEDELIDNVLDQDDRRLFYFLQDLGLLGTAWQEEILPTGRTWRVFYWHLNIDKIVRSATETDRPKAELGVYDELPSSVWSHEALAQHAE
jgi:hypothetical protein